MLSPGDLGPPGRDDAIEPTDQRIEADGEHHEAPTATIAVVCFFSESRCTPEFAHSKLRCSLADGLGKKMAGKIFINYRRGDDAGHTGRLFDRLQDVFEPQQLFMDVDNIAPGLDFVRVISERVAECDVMLAVIGKGWIDARDAMGARRLDDPDDFVRLEIQAALSGGKRVIPVLVGEASMPHSNELPEELSPLVRRNAVRLTHERFRADTEGLIKSLRQALEEIEATRRTQAEAVARSQSEKERQRQQHAANERAKAYRAAMTSADPSALNSFLDIYPDGSDANQARERLRRLERLKVRPSRRAIVAAGVLAVAFAGAFVFWSETKPPSQTPQLSPMPVQPPSVLPPSANKDARLSGTPDPLRLDLVTDCDRLASRPLDTQRPAGVTGALDSSTIDVVPALKACNEAMSKYPTVARFVFQAGRVAIAQKEYLLARQLFEKAADMGSVAAIAGIGFLYLNGFGVTQDYAKARQWSEKGADAGDPFAMAYLGFLYVNGWQVPKDYAQARQWFEKSAAAGSPDAMAYLGLLYMNGWGVSKDYAQARQWYEKSAAAGGSRGMTSLGALYVYGWGVSKDYAQARQWFEKAAAAGDLRGMAALGALYENGSGVSKDYAQARQLYEKAAAAGSPEAMNQLGILYANGHGVSKDYAQARQWYEKAAAAGSSDAMINLGNLYSNGQGVSKDYARAREWFEKAAAADSPDAMNELGVLYENGYGVSKNYVQARQWYEKAAAAGSPDAMTNLGNVYSNGWGVSKDYVRAREWYEKAAAAGSADAMNDLGILYLDGQGVSKDYARAREWFEKAAAAGSSDAMTNLGDLYSKDWGVSKDYARARQWYEQAATTGSDDAKERLKKLPK